ncbi:MAG: NADH-quinone oxidoreductase subunit N [Thermoleophilia bacterium]|nr:NADH-quinone oxidoreductase subunit N [Thermoleophilia bacterium]
MGDALLLLPKGAMGLLVLLGLLMGSMRGGRARRTTVLVGIAVLALGFGAGILLLGRSASFFHAALVVDRFSLFADLVLLALGVVISLAALDGPGAGRDGDDFVLLFALSLFGASVLDSAGSLIVIFLAVELTIIPSFALVAFRGEDRRSYEGALKYFILSVLASAVLYYGLSLIYGATGSVAVPLATEPETSALLLVGIGFTLVGFGFKLAAFPFHQWLPDAFEVSHPEVAAFLAVAPKLAAVVALVRILDGLGGQSGAWTFALALVAFGTMFWGNLAAFLQQGLRRMLAYSAIAHAGYALVGVAAGSARGLDGAVLYFAAYASAAVGAFLVVAFLEREGAGDSIAGLGGLGRRRPALAAALTVFLISLIGVPLFAGFWGKFSVFLGAIEGASFGWPWWGCSTVPCPSATTAT